MDENTKEGQNNLENYKTEHLYTSEFKNKNGKYMTYLFNESINIDISPRIALRLTYLNKDNNIEGLKITRIEKGQADIEMTFSKFDISHINRFLEFIKHIDLSDYNNKRIKLTENFNIDEENKDVITTILNSGEGLKFLKQFLINDNLTTEDLVNLSYRKKQLEIFEKMLVSDNTEPEWQKFFECNKWIFGYGLDFVFHESLLDKKLELYTTGSNFNESGFEVDALLKTKGAINNICLCEIKKPDTPLLANSSIRTDVWSMNTKLFEAIAQIQKNIFRMQEHFKTLIQPKFKNGDPTGEHLFIIKPKSFLIVGSLNEFKIDNRINESKLSSFELFRNNLISPEIITFDELFERAKAIVKNNEQKD